MRARGAVSHRDKSCPSLRWPLGGVLDAHHYNSSSHCVSRVHGSCSPAARGQMSTSCRDKRASRFRRVHWALCTAHTTSLRGAHHRLTTSQLAWSARACSVDKGAQMMEERPPQRDRGPQRVSATHGRLLGTAGCSPAARPAAARREEVREGAWGRTGPVSFPVRILSQPGTFLFCEILRIFC